MKKFLIALLIGMLLLILGATTLVTRSLAPFNQAEAETIELAQNKADLVTADEFYWFNGDETYFTVTGKNSEGTPIVVIVKQEGGSIQTFNQEDIISEREAIIETNNREQPERILEARIGIYKDQPVWEVSFRQENGRIGYTVLSLHSGQWIRTIKNI